MRANGDRKTKLYSPLAVDLALSRVNLAALKAKIHHALSQEEIESALELKDYFETRLETLQASQILPTQLMPERQTRDQLQATLATLAAPIVSQQSEDVELFSRLARLLDVLARSRGLEPSDATQLIGSLEELEDRSERDMHLQE